MRRTSSLLYKPNMLDNMYTTVYYVSSLIFNEIYRTAPHSMQDLISLPGLAYKNSPPISSRILQVTLKNLFEMFIIYDNSLSKSSHPVVSDVTREGIGVITTARNVQLGVLHKAGGEEKQDFTHLAGQTARFICKLSFQLPVIFNLSDTELANISTSINFNISDPSSLSRISNVFCNPVGIIGLDLSKQNQGVSYFVEPYNGWKDVGENLLRGRIFMNSFPKSMFKSIVTDQVGSVVKLISNSHSIEEFNYMIDEYLQQAISNQHNIPRALLSKDDNIYIHYNKILAATDNGFIGYEVCIEETLYRFIMRAIPDLFIIGPIMLSASNAATDYVSDVLSSKVSIMEGGRSIGAIGILACFKKQAFFYVQSHFSDLLGISSVFLDNDIYLYGKNHPGYILFLLSAPYINENIPFIADKSAEYAYYAYENLLILASYTYDNWFDYSE